MATKITKHYFEFGVHKYFRGSAHLVNLGSYGQKKDPIGAKAYLDIENQVKRSKLASRVNLNTVTSINWASASAGDVEVNGTLKVFGLGAGGTSSYSYSKAKSANLKLVNFSISEGPLKTMLNTDAHVARGKLADEGKDGRIVSEVWVLMEGDLAETFEKASSNSISIKAVGKSLDVTVSTGKSGSESVTLSKGTVFAYKMHKVKKWNKGKTKIEDMEADYKGMG